VGGTGQRLTIATISLLISPLFSLPQWADITRRWQALYSEKYSTQLEENWRFSMSQQLLIESAESLGGLRRHYEEALSGYGQGARMDPEGQEADREQSTAAGYAYVLRESLPIIDNALAYPTVSANPDQERKAVLDESGRRLKRLLEDWQARSLVANQAYHEARIAMLETVLSNLEAIQVYH
jgi:hypothetical protein